MQIEIARSLFFIKIKSIEWGLSLYICRSLLINLYLCYLFMVFSLPHYIFFAAFGLQLVFLVMLLIAFVRYKYTAIKNTSPVSVIVCARNAINELPKIIKDILEQEYSKFELVLVNDRSNDDTYSYLLEEVKKYDNLKVVTIEHKPELMDAKKYAITLGIKAAKYDQLLFTDADCDIHSTKWLETMASGFTNQETSIVLGASLIKGGKNLVAHFARYESLLTAIYSLGFAMLKMPYMGVGRNLGYRKDLFLKNKGFNTIMNITGGDDDLFVNKHANSKNVQVIIGEDSLIYTTPKPSWSSFFTQKLRHLSVGKKYRFSHKLVLGLVNLSHIAFWFSLVALVLLSQSIILLLILLAMRTLFLFLTFIIASKKLGSKFNMWGLVFLDFIFVFYYLSTGIRAFFTKRVRWS